MKKLKGQDRISEFFTIDTFLQMIPSIPHDLTKICFEVAGKDSAAAIIPILDKIYGNTTEYRILDEDRHEISEIIGIAMYHHGMYGNFNEPIENFKKVQNLIQKRFGEIQMRFFYLNVAELFEWTIVQPMAIIQKHYGAYSPCPACHLFLHMMRIPLLKHIGCSTLISGERSAHDDQIKLNQLPEILSLFPKFLQNHHISIHQPLIDIEKDGEVYALLGDSWQKSTPFNCIFSKNYLDETGKIPFKISQIKKELTEFYYPLFSKIVSYILRKNATPSHSWIIQEISSLF